MDINPEFIIWYNKAGAFELCILTIITIIFVLAGLLFISSIITGILSKDNNQSNSDKTDGIF
jgi:hypothetical protein